MILDQQKLYEANLPKPSFILQKEGDIVFTKDIAPASKTTKPLKCVRFQECASAGSVEERPIMSNNGSSSMDMEERQTAGHKESHKQCIKQKEETFYLMTHLDKHASKVIKISKPKKKERKCVMINIDFMPLIAGDLSVSNRLEISTDTIMDCYMTVEINHPIQQKKDLNPLAIRILSAKDLPTRPTPISVLQEKCLPVYCRYRFQDGPFHQTHGQTHGTHVFFRDVNVVFAGTKSPGKLREFLLGPPIEIEVHDRDQKDKEIIKKPSLFGMEPEDEKLSNVGLVTAKRTVHNPFTERDSLWDPYGIARMSLSELVNGARYLNLDIPIHACERPDPTGYNSDNKTGRILGVKGSVDGPQDSSLPVGHYLDAQSHLRVRVDLAVPLAQKTDATDCPFGRIIYVFDYKNKQLLYDVIASITKINSRTLGMDSNPVNITLDALSRVRLSEDQKNDTSLNIITGIHVMDGESHIFILEGLKKLAIDELQKAIPIRQEDHKSLKILYNSEMAFHERFYKDLEVLVDHIHLHEPLSAIMKRPLLYIRDMVPHNCFHALSRLDHICSAKKFRYIIQRDLLPSVEMIRDLSREFGIPFNIGDLFTETEKALTTKLVMPDVKAQKWHPTSTLDNFNQKYILSKETTSTNYKNHIKENIQQVHKMSLNVTKENVKCIDVLPLEGPYNYSCQKLAKEPNQKEKWKTPNGFQYPGFKSSIECNQHPKKPDDTRIEDLKKVWKENILHGNTLQPTLSRDRWSWAERNVDFDIYKKVPERRSLSAPATASPEDDILEKTQKAISQEMGVIQPGMQFYRRLPQTELSFRGPQASNQLDRLGGLLKDQGMKLSLKKPGIALRPIPALAVLQNPDIDESDATKGFIPGELSHSLKWTENAIPRHNMEHDKFQQLRGDDFDLHSMEHLFMYQRRIKPLSTDERNTFNLMKPKLTKDTKRHSTKMATALKNLIQIQSHEGVFLLMQ